MWPGSCSGDTCQYVVTYRTVENGHFVDIEMMGETDGYLAIGISHDLKMVSIQIVTRPSILMNK